MQDTAVDVTVLMSVFLNHSCSFSQDLLKGQTDETDAKNIKQYLSVITCQ